MRSYGRTWQNNVLDKNNLCIKDILALDETWLLSHIKIRKLSLFDNIKDHNYLERVMVVHTHIHTFRRLLLLLLLFFLPRTASRMFFAVDAVKMLRHMHYIWMARGLDQLFLQIV